MSEAMNGGRVAEELRSLLGEAEALLRTSVGTNAAEMQERAQETLRELRARLATLEREVGTRVREVDSYVRDNPWQALAAVGALALLVGIVMARRS